ncbi:uncharacterized protein LOC120335095 isoform X2 [Styela clava]
MKMNPTVLVIIVSIIITSASAQDPWKKECVDGFELLFFKRHKTYNSAKYSCEGLGGYLAKVDNERMTTVINSAFDIRGGDDTFYIGGNDIANEGDWRWQDGTDVIMKEETGYQNWKWNQPNNVGNEDCLVVGRQTYEWVDTSCDGNFYYICQKVFPGPFVRIQTINVHQKRCSATNCSAAIQVEWRKASNKVSTENTSRVYQTIQNGSATLNLQHANIADAGSYSCRYQIGQTWKATTESYGVDGNPTIHQISNNVCNSNLIISWQPHLNAVGFPHKIEVSPTSGGSTRWVDSPTSEKQSTTITSFSPITTYTIKITACVTKDNCPTKYSTFRNVTTGGAKLSAESSSIIQYKNTQTCVISWILSNKTETSDSYTVELNLTSTLASSRDSNLKTDMKLINVTSSSVYSFQPESNRNYSASIKIFSCAGFGQVLSVTGSCLGKPRAPTKVFPPDSFEDNLVSSVCGFEKLGIQAPDETNGLVSCIFVLVRTNLKEHDVAFSLTDMININNTVSGDKYIAKAIPVSSMNGKRMNITLGDESMTTCTVINTEKAGIQNEESSGKEILFTGRNKKLDKKMFSVSIVYSTPSGDQIHVSRSPSLTLKQGEQETTAKNNTEKGAFEFNIISFVIGFLIPFVFLVVSVWIIYKMKKEIKNLEEKAEVKEHNYETIKEKATPSNNPASQPSYSNVLQETAGYEQPLPAKTKQTQVESAYEQLSSSNVLQETAGYEQGLPATTKKTQVESAYEQPSSSNVLQETAGYEQALPATTKQTQVETAYESYNA